MEVFVSFNGSYISHMLLKGDFSSPGDDKSEMLLLQITLPR